VYNSTSNQNTWVPRAETVWSSLYANRWLLPCFSTAGTTTGRVVLHYSTSDFPSASRAEYKDPVHSPTCTQLGSSDFILSLENKHET
jgi:hypothetical protein